MSLLSKLLLIVLCIGVSFGIYAQESTPVRPPKPTPESPRLTPTVKAVYRALPSTVSIRSTRSIFPTIQGVLNQANILPSFDPTVDSIVGSGFFVSKEGHIITCAHILDNATSIAITTYNNQKFKADILAINPKMDIALLKARIKSNTDITPIAFADVNDILLGETVIAIGSPLGYHGSISSGILSGASRRLLSTNNRVMLSELIQLNISTHSGASGSPVINLDGDVLGIMVLKYKLGDNIGFALPVEHIRKFIVNYATIYDITRRDWGIKFDPNIQGSWNVKSIAPHTPFYGKINVSDTIYKVNGIPTAQWIEAIYALWDMQSADLTLTTQKGIFSIPRAQFHGQTPKDIAQKKFGVNVIALSPTLAIATRYVNFSGVIVSSARPHDELKRGDLIVSVNNIPIPDAETFYKILAHMPVGTKISLGIAFHDKTYAERGLISIRTLEIYATE